MDRIVPVAIGLPVYNGEKSLAQSIESVLAQDFGDFDFLISDNCSTDSTWEICNHYASKDKRIRLNRFKKNFGCIRNFNSVLNNTKSKYFMWHAHDDLLDSQYVGKCHRFLEENDDYALCCTKVIRLDKDIKPLSLCRINEERAENGVLERIEKYWANGAYTECIYGLIRRHVLDRIGDLPLTPMFSDLILVSEIILHGKVHQIDEFLRHRSLPTGPKAVLLNFKNHGPQTCLGTRLPISVLPFTKLYTAFASRIDRVPSLSREEKLRIKQIAKSSIVKGSLLETDARHYFWVIRTYFTTYWNIFCISMRELFTAKPSING